MFIKRCFIDIFFSCKKRRLKYELLKKDGKARLGKLHTNHGTFDTPMFMPAGPLANVKTLVPEELKDMNSAVILSNTYHLWLRPGGKKKI